MANTVVAIFDSKTAAEQAQQYLISAGYTPQQIEIKIASYKPEGEFPISEQEDHALLDKITAFFRDLFGADHEDVAHYAHASKAGIVLTVHTDTHADAEKVSKILDAYGADDATAHAGREATSALHTVSDHGENHTSQADGSVSGNIYSARASRIKSRIVERNLGKQNNETEY